tara:strand:+ start:427 stop:1056 length:630 start_codon:yes stop_codon:yes gene_type:complete
VSRIVDKIYEQLLEKSPSNRVKNNLSVVKKACDFQLDRKSKDFSIATIGRLSESFGGVKTQSIRNATGQVYRDLINAYKSENPVKAINTTPAEPISWAGRIEDPEIRYRLLDLVASERKLRNELNQLKAVKEVEVDLRLESKTVECRLYDSLTDIEIKALSDFISSSRLSNFGWSIGTNGRLLDSNGKPVTKPGFVDGIQKVLTINSYN